MKLLLDQNLPPSLKRNYPGSQHVSDVGLETADDEVVWEYARDNEFTIISKDGDFQHLASKNGPPPKVIWLRVGNCRTSELAAILAGYQQDLLDFAADPVAGLLILS